MRLLFWQATADAGWPGSVWYQGDATTWLGWAEALQRGVPFEVGLPLRPPGAAYLIAALGDPSASGLIALKFAWCLMGALAVGLVYTAARRSFGAGTALAVGLLCAASSGLMMLSTSLNNETPYLLLVAATLALWRSVRDRPGASVLALWAVLHAAACLVRAEHLLYFSLLWIPLTLHWLRGQPTGARSSRSGGHFDVPATDPVGGRPTGPATGHPARGRAEDATNGPGKPLAARLRATASGLSWRPTLLRLAGIGVIFALALSPWHLHAWSQIDRFNTEPLPVDGATEAAQAQIERMVDWISWSPAAEEALARLPGATRRTSRLFITATEGVRGGSTVGAESFRILEEAFGSIPEPLPARPYLVLYGGLNFHLANHSASRGGFDRTPLERPPPLAGGRQRYPTILIQGLPPTQLTLTYPPHLEVIEHGYRLGWEWIRSQPLEFLQLVGHKLRIFWSGAALGLGGYNLPVGLSGVRRPVDLLVPAGDGPAGAWLISFWQFALLALTLVGLWVARSDPETRPWTLFLLSRLLVTAAFYGYARQGASTIPVVVLLVCLAMRAAGRSWTARTRRTRSGTEAAGGNSSNRARGLPPPLWRHPLTALIAFAILLLVIETGRWLAHPEITIDGHTITATPPFPPDDHQQRIIHQ